MCEPATASDRMVANRGLSRDEAEQRLASARDWRERAPLVDRLLPNDGTLSDFAEVIDAAIRGRMPRPRAEGWPHRHGDGRGRAVGRRACDVLRASQAGRDAVTSCAIARTRVPSGQPT